MLKITNKILKEKYWYDTFIFIYLFPTLIKLTYFLGGIQMCVAAVGKYIFDKNIVFVLPLTFDEMGFWCTNNDEPRGSNGCKGWLKGIRFSPTENNKFFVHKRNWNNVWY